MMEKWLSKHASQSNSNQLELLTGLGETLKILVIREISPLT